MISPWDMGFISMEARSLVLAYLPYFNQMADECAAAKQKVRICTQLTIFGRRGRRMQHARHFGAVTGRNKKGREKQAYEMSTS